MQRMAFRDKISRRGKFSRRLTSRTPTFIVGIKVNIYIMLLVNLIFSNQIN